MGNLFNQFESPILPKDDVTIAEHFPVMYISSLDDVFCYTGVLFNLEERSPNLYNNSWKLSGKHSTDRNISESIKGFYRIINGCIIIDDYVDNRWNDAKYKLIDRIIRLPISAQTYYGVVESGTFKEDKELTRKVFGLTFHELQEILTGYAKIFGIYNDYRQYPRLTRSVTSDNFCDLTDLWIPKQFPYIAFKDSQYLYSHVSLWGFYTHLSLLMNQGKESIMYQEFLKIGISESTMDALLQINERPFYGRTKVNRDSF